MDNLRALFLAISIGLGVGGLWALVFRIPVVIRDANLRSLAAESMRREAELAQLRSSLQPHFLLNTLNTVAALVVDEPLVARKLLAALGDLLRDALEPAPEMRPLEADIHWLRRYAEILEVRHRGALRFEWAIAPETTAVLLPKLLLQPLLENAVKHGVLARDEGGVVTVRTRFIDKALQLVVEDNGSGLPPGTQEGLGLRIVRERIGLAHPDASLRLESSSEGTRATVEIPHSQEAG
jgi:LytS/YehU family sensor histidine kinase